jgi:tetratricopeptide (TPR) repeat protein
MQNIPKTVRLILILVALTQASWAAEDLMTSNLVGQARHWQTKDRDDLAAEIWRSVLRSEPAHGEALVKLGLIEAKVGNLREAAILLDQATRVSPKPRGLTELNAALSNEALKTESAVLPALKPLIHQTKAQPQTKESKPKTTSAKKTTPATAQDPLLLKP